MYTVLTAQTNRDLTCEGVRIEKYCTPYPLELLRIFAVFPRNIDIEIATAL